MSNEDKRSREKIKKKRQSTIEKAVKNVEISLKKMGIKSAEVVVDNNVAYILFKVDDVAKMIQKKTKASVKKVAGNSCEVACYIEDNVMVVRVRKGNV